MGLPDEYSTCLLVVSGLMGALPCLQTSGEALYTSDIGLGGSELHAVPVLSSQALATLEDIDPSKALKVGIVETSHLG